jgi:tetratricopeptide (TPR) repeat protein
MKKYFGRGRSEIRSWLLNVWLKEGPPLCFLDGFPGVGKTDLALELLDLAERQGKWEHVVINEVAEDSKSVLESLMDLSSKLSLQGLPEMETVLFEQKTPSIGHAIEKALQRSVVIVIDHAQRLFVPDKGSPLPEMNKALSYLRNRPALRGRLLLLSDRFVEQDRYSEWIPRRTLRELAPEEAAEMFDARLKEVSAVVEIPWERKTRVLKTLHFNPRAVEALVGRLQSSTLDQIIADHPGLWGTEDPQIDRGFLKNLERDLLQQTMNEFSEIGQKRLWRLSVYRRNFQREALEKLGGPPDETAQWHASLITRFFLNFYRGSFTLNPIVREISLSHLKDESAEFKQAHSAAADYYLRPFTAKQMVGTYGKLAEYFAELRYHLVQAGRQDELSSIGHRFTDHLKQEIKMETPVPQGREELDYRIGVLTVLLQNAGARGLEYHLARCLQARNNPGDLQQAESHAQRSVGVGRQEAPWILLAHITRQLKGNAEAISVIRRGLRTLSDVEVAGPLFRLGAEILADDKKIENAVTMLKEGIKVIPPEKNLFSLYELGSEILCRGAKPAEAVALLREGIPRIPRQLGQQRLEVCAILLCAGSGIGGLEELISDAGNNSTSSYSAALGRILLRELGDDWVSAAKLAKSYRESFPRDPAFATHEALARLANEDNERALVALTSFPNFAADGSVMGWLEAFIHLRRGQSGEAERILEVYLKRQVNRALELNEPFLLRLWDEQESSPHGNRLCFNLPILPPSLTGVSRPVRRLQFANPVLRPRKPIPPSAGATRVDRTTPEIYISYAWGDDETDEGRQREKIVRGLCEAVRASGREIGRDKELLGSGHSIDRFGKDISKANRIIAVISEKYLHSEFCIVRELFRTYMTCRYESAEFQERVIAIMMDDAKPLMKSHFALANQWKEKNAAKRQHLSEHDPNRKNRDVWQLLDLAEEMVIHLPGMLEALNDIIMPQTMSKIVADDFQDVIRRLP